MPDNIPAPPSAPRSTNLLTSARLVSDSMRWENGITFTPEPCNPGGSTDPYCVDPEDVEGKTAGTAMGAVSWSPFNIYTYDTCPYALNEQVYADLAARARRKLLAQTSHLVEQIFWTGTVDGVDFTSTHDNVALTQISVGNTGTPAPPVGALTQIDTMLIAALGGEQGMIHVPNPLMHHLAFYGLIRREGNVWMTTSGNIVVPGTGYSGTDPDNAEDPGNLWIYGTSMVEIRLGDVVVLPGSVIEAVDRETNALVVRAERLAIAYWDLCAHVGVPVCTTDPGPACSTES